MQRYEFSDDKSSKFWEAELVGKKFTVHYGKIGTEGRTQSKTFPTKAEAQEAANKAAAAKVKKGYKRIGLSMGESISMADRSPALEAAIYEYPEDPDTWAVYGDFLQAREDPRGELIALEVARAKGDKKASLKTRLNKVLKEMSPTWLGPTLTEAQDTVLDEDGFEVTPLVLNWKYGFIHSFRITTFYGSKGPQWESLLKELLKNSSSRFVDEIIIGPTGEMLTSSYNEYEPYWKVFKSVGPLPSVRKLFAGDRWDISSNNIGNFDKILPLLPNLEWLKLRGINQTAKKLKHSNLKTLLLPSGALPAETIRAMARAELPRLETLEVWFGSEDYGASGGIKDLKPFFKNPNFPALRHLGLKNANFQNDIAVEIVKSPLLKQLLTLDLSLGTMTDAGATALLETADALKHLEKINLKENFISEEFVAKLEAGFGKRVETGGQGGYNDEDDLYVSVGE